MAIKTRKRKETFEEVFTKAGLLPKWNAQAEAKGKAEGKAEGIAENKSVVARNLLAMKMPVEKIAQAVQLPIKEIQALAAG